jgi:hypothetical protein
MGLSSGRTVRLFLVDGAATGLMTAEILSWTGRALVAPRSRLPDVLKRQEARRAQWRQTELAGSSSAELSVSHQ